MSTMPKWVRGAAWGVLAAFLGYMALMSLGSTGTLGSGGYDRGYYPEGAMYSNAGDAAMAPSLDAGSYDYAASEEAATVPAPIDGATAEDHGLKVVKTGTVVLKAADPAETLEELKTLAGEYDAFVDDESLSQGDAPRGYAVFRVESSRYEEFVAAVKASGEVESVSISKADMTKSYNDMAALLESNEAELAAVQALLDRAERIEDILAIRSQTERLRAENRQLKASLDYIDDQASYSTLTVDVQSPAAIRGEEYWGRNTVQAVLDAFQSSLRAVVLFLAALLPWAVAAAAALGLWRALRRLTRRHPPETGATAEEASPPSE